MRKICARVQHSDSTTKWLLAFSRASALCSQSTTEIVDDVKKSLYLYQRKNLMSEPADMQRITNQAETLWDFQSVSAELHI